MYRTPNVHGRGFYRKSKAKGTMGRILTSNELNAFPRESRILFYELRIGGGGVGAVTHYIITAEFVKEYKSGNADG